MRIRARILFWTLYLRYSFRNPCEAVLPKVWLKSVLQL